MFRSRTLAAVAAALTFAAIAAAPASAEVGFSDCDTPASSPVFAPWLDSTDYFLAPDGGFESGGGGWSLDSAAVGAGNESFNLSGAGASSLSLGTGASATSPAVCVGLEHPTFRFVARRTAGTSLSALKVDVVLADGTSVTVGSISGSSSWQPSPIMVVGANLLPLVAGGYSTHVAFRFTATAGSWQIDDVYVDPRGTH